MAFIVSALSRLSTCLCARLVLSHIGHLTYHGVVEILYWRYRVSDRPTASVFALVERLRKKVDADLRAVRLRWPDRADLIEDALAGGNRTRPVLCLLSYAAVGGRARDARPVALAVELGHKASVLRDDIEDGDTVRRGRPTFHAQHGIPLAVAVSDLLWTASLTTVANARMPARERRKCMNLFIETFHDMARGQFHDVAVQVMSGHPPRRRARVDGLKTGSLSALAFTVGAIAGGGRHGEVEALTRFGYSLGTAFQLVNDVNNLLGNEMVTGRPAGTDIQQGRYTPLVAYAAQRLTGRAKKWFVELIR